jgi:cation:H+ antiporter
MLPVAIGDVVALISAIPLAAIGGELFLKGVLGLAEWLRLPKLLVATTLAAFATSTPELTVSSMAALAGKPEIGLGDALGSNVLNLALILGMALLFRDLPAQIGELRRDIALALSVPLLTLLFAVDGMLSRIEGCALLLLCLFWLGLTVRQAIQHRQDGQTNTSTPLNKTHFTWLFTLAGLMCLVVSGRLFVSGAAGIATAIGIHSYVIGATVVALGTSLPELVTTLLSRWRGHDDIGLGTLLGSNLFNGLAIVGIAASIHPIHASQQEVSIALLFGFLSVLLILPRRGRISRRRGMMLLVSYVAYVVLTIST